MQGERVLILCPEFHEYHLILERACRALGAECLLRDERACRSTLDKLLTRIRLRQRWRPAMQAYIRCLVADVEEFVPDTILIVNPEMITPAMIAALRRVNPRLRIMLYLWDPLRRKPGARRLIDAVDVAYSFDLWDCEKERRLVHLPLFHANSDPEPRQGPERWDYCFVGTAGLWRLRALARIGRSLTAAEMRFFFYLYAPSRFHHLLFGLLSPLTGYRGILTMVPLPYEDCCRITAAARCSIDLARPGQSGLTIRCLEILFGGGRLITTNDKVLLYDFSEEAPVAHFSPEAPCLPMPDKPAHARWQHWFEKYHVNEWLRTILSGARPQYLRVSDSR